MSPYLKEMCVTNSALGLRGASGSASGHVAASSIAEHMFTSDHQVDLSKATVIDAHPHTWTHCLHELWHILHQQST